MTSVAKCEARSIGARDSKTRSVSEDDLRLTSEDCCDTAKAVVSGPRLMSDNDWSEYTRTAFRPEFESELEEAFFGEVEYRPNRRPRRIEAVAEAFDTYRPFRLSQVSSPSSCVCPDTVLSDPKVFLLPRNRRGLGKNLFLVSGLVDPNGNRSPIPSVSNRDPFL